MTTLITGNTYPVKDQLKALGGKWDPKAKGWLVPDDKADAARKLVGGSGGSGTVYRPHAHGGCSCTSDCCRPRCRCGSHCNCRGGPIYDC